MHIPAAVPLPVFRLSFPTQTLYTPGRVLHHPTIPRSNCALPSLLIAQARPGTWLCFLDAIPVAFSRLGGMMLVPNPNPGPPAMPFRKHPVDSPEVPTPGTQPSQLGYSLYTSGYIPSHASLIRAGISFDITFMD